ncbi:hypothetical protein [Segatella copri]|uniref:Uncharacterized protein n=1 Tax=Segatella copri TaxID=165179 RepID=A0AAW5UBT9_9BACT|nr:hypothetical protein [Segatella copri]MCW4138780.1 hypothetical protein [Segatella copri]MCW4144739.1 hypothetical protein [Segatella copri]MCW4169225.1 hypothetical protein [Segatella copri]
MDNLEQDIIDYIELGKLVTDIEAQFSRITSKHPTPILAVWTISATFAPC